MTTLQLARSEIVEIGYKLESLTEDCQSTAVWLACADADKAQDPAAEIMELHDDLELLATTIQQRLTTLKKLADDVRKGA